MANKKQAGEQTADEALVRKVDEMMSVETVAPVKSTPPVTKKTITETAAPSDSPKPNPSTALQSPQPVKTQPAPAVPSVSLEDVKTDAAVAEIIRQEGDDLLAAEDLAAPYLRPSRTDSHKVLVIASLIALVAIAVIASLMISAMK